MIKKCNLKCSNLFNHTVLYQENSIKLIITYCVGVLGIMYRYIPGDNRFMIHIIINRENVQNIESCSTIL